MAHANMTETAVSPDAGSESLATAPDWEKVPFDVGCARCGNDLRGLTEPKCPGCSLEFDWAEAVPIEELTCAFCGYHLYGLATSRCPECGKTFEWSETLARYHRIRLPYFEYRWRDRPVKSFFGTWWRTLRPKRFWARMNLHDPPAVAALGAMVVIQTAGVYLAIALAMIVPDIIRYTTLLVSPPPAFAARGYTAARILAWAAQDIAGKFTHGIVWSGTAFCASWILLSLFSLLVFQQSMRRCRVRTSQVIRVWSYSMATALPPILFAATSTIQLLSRSWAWRGYAAAIAVIGVILVLLFVVRSIRYGYATYLGMRHALAVAISSQAMALMATLVIGDAVTSSKTSGAIVYMFGKWLGAW